jgi:hypothetical protein
MVLQVLLAEAVVLKILVLIYEFPILYSVLGVAKTH